VREREWTGRGGNNNSIISTTLINSIKNKFGRARKQAERVMKTAWTYGAHVICAAYVSCSFELVISIRSRGLALFGVLINDPPLHSNSDTIKVHSTIVHISVIVIIKKTCAYIDCILLPLPLLLLLLCLCVTL
jgi:hypothetical protein